MKKLLLLVLLGAFVASFTATAQTTKESYKYVFNDTLKKSADSIKIFAFPLTITGQYDYTIQLIADSVAGATAAVAYLQASTSNPPGISFTNVPGKTMTVDGLKSETFLTGSCTDASKIRIRWVKGTGWTQVTRIRAVITLTKVTQTSFKSADTISLSNRIDRLNTLKLARTDTASLSDRINLKLTKTDTASLSNRINLKPTIVTGADTTNSTPSKAGNIFIRSNGDVYISKSAARGGWVKLN